MAWVVTLMRRGPISPISFSRMLSRCSSMRMVNTITASAVPRGLANGVTKSMSCAYGDFGVSVTGIGFCGVGSACFSRSLSAFCAWAILPTPGFLSSRILAVTFLRYSGSFAASETACTPATVAIAPITEKPNATTMHVESTRPSFQRSRRRTAGASRKASSPASANGISTSRARNRTAAAISRAIADAAPVFTSGELEEQQRARRHLVLVADGELRVLGRVREIGVGAQRPGAAAGRGRQLELHHVLPGIEDDEQRRKLAAAADVGLLRAPVEQHAEDLGVGVVPLVLAHLLAGGV